MGLSHLLVARWHQALSVTSWVSNPLMQNRSLFFQTKIKRGFNQPQLTLPSEALWLRDLSTMPSSPTLTKTKVFFHRWLKSPGSDWRKGNVMLQPTQMQASGKLNSCLWLWRPLPHLKFSGSLDIKMASSVIGSGILMATFHYCMNNFSLVLRSLNSFFYTKQLTFQDKLRKLFSSRKK